jgi:hypothetical protein
MMCNVTRAACLVVFFMATASWSHAAPIHVLSVDLPKLIDEVAGERNRFAVEVPHYFSSATDGDWQSEGAKRIWHYSVQVPTAISLSFHASGVALPASAVLTVTGSRATVQYRSRDLAHGVLWSRPMVGDALSIALSVDAAEASGLHFEVDGVQAGYRGLGSLPSHPYYLSRAQSAGTTQSCTLNYSCEASSANQGPSHAVVAVLVGNLYQCTGTLVNDTSGDFVPYVLTARHCENGTLGGGAPQAASTVSVYWDAVAPCGGVLPSIYDGSAPSQSFATTIVEQQDAWLIRLDGPPVATDAYWSGWDATGGVFSGGYSIHHALGYDKQFVGWYGQAILQNLPGSTLDVKYASTFWGVVNQTGSVGAGASGAALFDPNNRLVGSASLAALQNGANSAGVCPANPPPTPAPDTVTAQFTAFSSVFASTADTTSSTATLTLQSVLDSAHTGALVIDGLAVLPVTLSTSQQVLTTVDTTTLAWSATGATSCTAAGGASGDGWAGTKAASGSATIANYSGGQITYSITCTGPGLKGSATVSVNWIYTPPTVSLQTPSGPTSIGGQLELSWSSNVAPCTGSGGLAGDGWVGAKAIDNSQNLVESKVGNVTYVLTCGTAPQTATAQVTVSIVPVSVTMSANATSIRVGSTIQINWMSGGFGDSCSAVGGSPTDQWSSNIYLGSSSFQLITETVPGTYTYGVHCTGGGQTADSSVNVTWTNDAPALSITAVSPTRAVYPQLPVANPTVDLQWSSNVAPCNINVYGPFGVSKAVYAQSGNFPNGTASDAEAIAGVYTYTLQCNAGQYQASTTITWTNASPQLTLTTPTFTWVANYGYAVSWSTDTTPCALTGGAPGDGWSTSNNDAGQGFPTVTESAPGSYTFTLTCGTGLSRGQAQLTVTVPPAAASISASPSSVAVGQLVQLTWNSTVSPCTAVDPSGANWGGSNVVPGGSIPVIETAAGTYTYAINCGSGSQLVHASTQVTVEAPPPTTISANLMTAVVDAPVTLTWNSAGPVCTATGGDGVDRWEGTKNGSGTAIVTAPSTGTITYGISCNNEYSQTQVAYIAPSTSGVQTPTPAVVLTSSISSQVVGQSVTLSWSAKNSSDCIGSGGDANDGWSGSLGLSGTMQVSETSTGTHTYVITCTGAPPAAVAKATVDFTTSATSSGGGGGGALGALSLLWMALPLVARMGRRWWQRQTPSRLA